jgi:hypothetical protein
MNLQNMAINKGTVARMENVLRSANGRSGAPL